MILMSLAFSWNWAFQKMFQNISFSESNGNEEYFFCIVTCVCSMYWQLNGKRGKEREREREREGGGGKNCVNFWDSLEVITQWTNLFFLLVGTFSLKTVRINTVENISNLIIIIGDKLIWNYSTLIISEPSLNYTMQGGLNFFNSFYRFSIT